jgi:DNA-directed RNA polymerase-3 subunit RPC5
MSIKSADSGGGELTTETMADRLRTVQTEAWSKLKYEDEDSARAWTVFNDNLVYRSASKAGAKDGKAQVKGKGKERETDIIQIDSTSSSDSEQLQAKWDTDEFLKAVSAMRNGPGGSQKPVDAVEVKKEGGSDKTTTGTASGVRKAPNVKGKSVAFKGTDI